MADEQTTTAAKRTAGQRPLRRRTLLGAGAAVLGSGALIGSAPADRADAPIAAPGGAPGSIPDADQDSLELLKRMLSFDTQNSGQGGTTRAHAEMLRGVWQSAGVDAQIIDTPQPDNVHLLARIMGTGQAEPMLFLGHSDVVPVEAQNWTADPFAGEIRDGEIYGRGALDMKGANSAAISALLRHLDEGAVFDRDIIVLTDCDEEAGSFGSKWLAATHWDELDAGAVLTEGGWFLAGSDQRSPMLITATRQDKVYFNLKITAQGVATHSSKPIPEDSAVVTLSRAVSELGDWEAPVHLTEVTREYFRALAEATEDERFAQAIRLMLEAAEQSTLERAAGVMVSRSDYPYLHRALLRTTHAFVIEEAGYKENVIPSSAEATVNCRAVPGGQRPSEFLDQVRELLADRDVEVSLAAPEGQSAEEHLAQLEQTWSQPPADLDDDLYRSLSAAARRIYPEAGFAPALFEAGTSLGPWREKGIPGYGVYPYVLSGEQLITMHGNDERIFVEALAQGTEYMYEVFAAFRL